MPSITIKNIPDELYDELKATAQHHRRSINNEVIMLLEEQLRPKQNSREELLERARQCREMTRDLGIFVTEEEIDAAINEGRP